MANKLFTTQGSETILTELFHWTKIEYAALARIAIALSMKQSASRVNIEKDETGKEFNRYSLSGSYDIFLKSMLSLVHGRQLSDEEYFPTYMKSHLDDGCTILNRIWKESEGSVDQFLAKISAAAPTAQTKIYSGRVPRFEITVGQEQLTNEPVILRLNDILGGTPVFKGTRVPVKTLFEYLENNYSLDEFLECFPSVTRELARRVLESSESALLTPVAA
jgi:DNA sulfur modification protein DndE